MHSRARVAAAVTLVTILAAHSAASAASPATAGAGELSLDRGAVTAVIASQIPGPQRVALGPLGTVTARFDAPSTVQFVDGGVEARLGLRLLEPGMAGTALFRFFPEVDAKSGIVRLRAMRAKGEGPLALIPDVSGLLPPITMPRQFDWLMENRSGGKTSMAVEVREVVVRQDRLVVVMGLRAAPVELKAAR